MTLDVVDVTLLALIVLLILLLVGGLQLYERYVLR